MEEKNIARFPSPWGRIPNFKESDKAAEKLMELKEWKKARVIFANPDAAQQKVRELALKDGKLLIMASPRLKRDYIEIDPKKVRGKERFASTIKGAFKLGKIVKEFPKPDLIVTGCVAVDPITGYRLGKGEGYGDVEIRTIKSKYGEIPVVTTVHEVQIVENVPFEAKDTKVDIIVTPKGTIRIPKET